MTTPRTALNYFLLLALDPDAPWTDATYQAALNAKKAAWTRQLTAPGLASLDAKANLEQVKEIERVMADPALRGVQAAEARTTMAADRKEQLERFQREIQLRGAKGFVTEKEVAALVSRFSVVTTEADVRLRLRTAGIDVRGEPAAASTAAALDAVKATKIRELCQRLGKKNLYDALGRLTGAESLTVLHQRAAELHNEAQSNANKTALVTFTAELAGFGMEVFASADLKSRYDVSLAEEQFAELDRQVDSVGSITGQIYAAQVQLLLEQARQQGLSAIDAERRIRTRATTKKWAFEVPDLAAVNALRRCGGCHALNPPTAGFCSACSQPLQYPCPGAGCSVTVASDAQACTACGFPGGNRAWVQLLLRECEELERRNDVPAARERLAQASAGWPAAKGEIAGAIAERRRAVDALEQQRVAALDQLRALMNENRLYTARERLARGIPGFAPADAEIARIGRDVASRIQGVEQDLVRIDRDGLSQDEAVRVCRRVLSVCADCTPALNRLRSIPPAAPRGLAATSGGRLVSLRWAASPSDAVQYGVVRKAGSQPSSSTDGTRIATVAGLAFDDTAPEVGLSLFYAVYADRDGVCSTDAARLIQPVQVFQEVTALTASVSDRRVELTWQPPANVHAVIVVRGDQRSPRTPADGVRLTVLNGRQAVDPGLLNNRPYFYTVFAVFADHQGKEHCSAGATVTATPQTPPTPIETVDISSVAGSAGRTIVVSWAPQPKGTVVVLRSDRQPNLKPGQVLPVAALSQHGRTLTGAGNSVTDTWQALGACYYTPIVIVDGMAYAGQSHYHICIEDVADLKAHNSGTALCLEWTWPAGCEEVLISYAYAGWPAADAPGVKVSRAEYERSGHYDLLQPAKQDHFVVVRAVLQERGQRLIAPGSSTGARLQIRVVSRVNVQYAIERPRFRGKWRLRLSTDREVTLPTLLLVRKPRAVPLAKDDGKCVQRLKGPLLVKRDWSIDLSPDAPAENSYARLFLEDDSLYDAVYFLHPAADRLKLF